MKFIDGAISLFNKLTNRRNAAASNYMGSERMDVVEMRKFYKNGLVNKIYTLLATYSLSKTLTFAEKTTEDIYEEKLSALVIQTAIFQLAFGRGIIVINDGGDLERPLIGNVDIEKIKLHPFGGDSVAVEASHDLNFRYKKAITYQVNEFRFHWTRVIDFTYKEPVDIEKAEYYYGGISLAELIRDAIIGDAVIHRSIPTAVEKSSSFFYKMEGFKEALQNKKEELIVDFVTTTENYRTIHGAGIIDSNDDVTAVTQTLQNLKESSDIMLQRVCTICGIPVSELVGEPVKGLNSSGDSERDALNDTASGYQNGYLINPINQLLGKLGLGTAKFNESGKLNPTEQVNFDKVVIENAGKLKDVGWDVNKYLKEKGIKKDSISEMFPADKDEIDDVDGGYFEEKNNG